MSESQAPPIPEDGWRPLDTKPDQDVRVLFIEGYGMVAWMETSIAQNFTTDGVKSFRVWVTTDSYLSELHPFFPAHTFSSIRSLVFDPPVSREPRTVPLT